MRQVSNTRIKAFTAMDAPEMLREQIPASDFITDQVCEHREAFKHLISGVDKRFAVIVGPCSIHDEQAAYEYAERLNQLRSEVSPFFFVVMRVYFEKPRTRRGWKGLINDPHLDESFDVVEGVRKARKILRHICSLGIPCATEFLDPIIPQYTADLVTWAAIGARTTESQTHREMASGLSMPVGFKNATDGSVDVAINAMASARSPHAFLGINDQGKSSIVRTAGNSDVHLVLRGGGGKPNYRESDIASVKGALKEFGDGRLIMVDCSHGNSCKDYTRQPLVFEDLLRQFKRDPNHLLGAMLESHLVEGAQSLGKGPLTFGQSITDGCLGWQQTVDALKRGAEYLDSRAK